MRGESLADLWPQALREFAELLARAQRLVEDTLKPERLYVSRYARSLSQLALWKVRVERLCVWEPKAGSLLQSAAASHAAPRFAAKQVCLIREHADTGWLSTLWPEWGNCKFALAAAVQNLRRLAIKSAGTCYSSRVAHGCKCCQQKATALSGQPSLEYAA